MTAAEPTHDRRPRRLSGLRASWMLVAGSAGDIERHSGSRMGRTWLWMGLLGIAWGLGMAGIWALAAHVYPWWKWWQTGSSLPIMPVAAIIAALSLTPLRRVLTAPAHLLSNNPPAEQGAFAAATVVVLMLLLLGIQPYRQESTGLPHWLTWVRPMAEYRVLILMPMWGVWAMMVPLHFCRPAEGACTLARAMVKHQPVAATALWMAVTLALTLWELNFLGAWAALPAAAA
ncbi:unnamed protein product, partial [marine sediment metagenome]